MLTHHRKKLGRADKKRSLAKGAAAAAAAFYLGGDCADADIVLVQTPISVTGDGQNQNWDIDGTPGNEYRLHANFFSTTFPTSTSKRLFFSRRANGRGFVRKKTTDGVTDFRNLPLGFNVGPTLATNYTFDNAAAHIATSFGSFVNAQDFTDGVDGYIGFQFDPGDGLHYGWARVNIDAANALSHELTIHEWAYESTAGTAIQVGAIPEPSGAIFGLGLLATGIAGVRRWKRSKKVEQDTER